LAQEEDFCTALTLQIIDERKAQQAYKQLLGSFEEELPLLMPSEDKTQEQKKLLKTSRADIIHIKVDEETHETTLEHLRKTFCEVKE